MILLMNHKRVMENKGRVVARFSAAQGLSLSELIQMGYDTDQSDGIAEIELVGAGKWRIRPNASKERKISFQESLSGDGKIISISSAVGLGTIIHLLGHVELEALPDGAAQSGGAMLIGIRLAWRNMNGERFEYGNMLVEGEATPVDIFSAEKDMGKPWDENRMVFSKANKYPPA